MSLDARTGESPAIRGVDDLVALVPRARAAPRRAGRSASSTRRSSCAPAPSSRSPTRAAAASRRCSAASSRFGYEPFEEEGRIIAAQKAGLTVSIEPGGQIELSGRPFADVHVVAAELDRHLEKCREIARELGVEFLAIGYRPWGTPASAPVDAEEPLPGDAAVPRGAGPARAGHDGDDRLGAGVLRLLRRARHGREAARRPRHPAGGRRRCTRTPRWWTGARSAGRATASRSGRRPTRRAAASSPFAFEPGFEDGRLPALRRVGARRPDDLPAPRAAATSTRAGGPSARSSQGGSPGSGRRSPTGRTTSRRSSPRCA